MASAAPAPRSKLRDFLTDNATKEFPDAFEIMNKAYKIKEHNWNNDSKVEMIEAGRYSDNNNNLRNSKPLFAKLDPIDGSIEWYYQKFGRGILPVRLEHGAEDLFPNEGIACHIGPKGPFSLVAPSSWPTDDAGRAVAIEASRSKLDSLVKFAFILEGNVESLPSQRRVDLLGELEELCTHMQAIQNNKTADSMSTVAGREDSQEPAQVEGSVALPIPSAVPAAAISATSPRRRSTRMGVAATQEAEHSPKRARTMRLAPAQSATTGVDPSMYGNAAQDITHSASAFLQQVQAEAEEKRALKAENQTLSFQLSAESKKADEAEAKLEEANKAAQAWKDSYESLKARMGEALRSSVRRSTDP
ncbi:hypothetical protein N0V87_010293 [Didymella glomerata]|uniref:Uncharacterized protein n=1 Tax=Didymella glomerata TaxID=749621 RepID=A0A9W8WQ35_9PLEO|nr:hypothetical protein N0V87_010293 [Didymella glomerata]